MSWKLILKALKNKEMQKKLLLVAFMVFVYRILAHIPVPVADAPQLREAVKQTVENQDLFAFVNLLSGGALANFSIVLMGLGPYINASIIMQLLSKVVPSLQALEKEGEQGRQKINQYTRILSVPLSIAQAVAMIFLLNSGTSGQSIKGVIGFDIVSNASPFDWVVMVSALVGGSLLLMWLGELISEQGVGNGISILIFAGIATQMPTITSTSLSLLNAGGKEKLDFFGWFSLPISPIGAAFVGGFLLASLIVTYLIVKLNEAQRIITISYAKRVQGSRQYGGVDSSLPIKLITAGVIPIIFAVAFLTVPGFIGGLMANSKIDWMVDFGKQMQSLFTFNPTSISLGLSGVLQLKEIIKALAYPFIYFFLVIAFTYFYTSFVFNSKEIAENLQKQGGFIANIRPGLATEKYLKKIVSRLTLFGSISLGLIAIMPFISQIIIQQTVPNISQLSQLFTLGGTSVLITVSVALETLRQIESRAMIVTYDNYE
jgi:preprotein translocase subunit SecY